MAGYHHRGEDPQLENERRLRAYDAAANGDQRNELAQGRLDLARSREAFDEAHKTSEAERKASEFQQRNELSTQRADILDQRLQLNTEIQKNNELLKQQAALAKEKATVARQKAGIDFYKGVADLNPQSPDFRQKFGNLMSSVQSNLVDTEGKIPEDVTKVADHLWAQHNTWASLQSKTQNLNPTQQLQDALASSHPIYGDADASGKNFAPSEAGTTPQSHVQVTYIPPGSSKAQTQVFPRGMFDSMVAASKSRQTQGQATPQASVAAPSPDAPTPAPAAPAIPQAHIDHLLQNPDTAGQFDAKYGDGASQQYLKRGE